MPDHVVITGASGGIGAALARVYSRAGVRLSLLGRDSARLDQAACASRALGAEVAIHCGDVADAAGLERWLVEIDSQREVDLLIANAGIGGGEVMARNSVESGDVARRVVSTNLLGVINTVTPLLPDFVARRRGHIAIVSSLAAFVGLPDCPSYAASKAAIRTYGDAVRRLVAARGVSVTIVYPGFVKTPMSASLPFQPRLTWDADRAAARIADGIARKRRQIIFPWSLGLAARASGFVPAAIVDRILSVMRVGA
jgi:short-subunit dehydrogenase